MKIDGRNDLATQPSCRCIVFMYNNIKSIGGGVIEPFTLAYECQVVWRHYNNNDNNNVSCKVISRLYDMYRKKIKRSKSVLFAQPIRISKNKNKIQYVT